MKRGIIVLLSLSVLFFGGYFIASKWGIHHTTLTFEDTVRGDRPVAVDIAVRRDREWEAAADMVTLPVAIVNHGNTVKFTEYSFLANLLAARGYMVSASSTTSTPTSDGDESRRGICRPPHAV